MRRTSIAIVIACCLAASVPAQARKLYKWYDDENVAHYTELPPADVESEIIRVSGHSSEPVQEARQPTKPAPVAESKREEAEPQKKTAKPEIDPETRKRYCLIARTDLEALRTHPRIYIKDEKTGEKRFMTPEEHESRTRSTEEDVRKYCD